MSTKPISVGLASFGLSGRVFHAPFIEKSDQFILKSILERTKNTSQELYPDAKIVRSYEELLEDQEIELIVVNTPPHLHYTMAKQALLAGKHIVVEKPFTTTSSEAEELIQMAEAANLILAVFQNRRLDGGYKTLRYLLTYHDFGPIEEIHMSIPRYRPEIGPKKWKEGDYDGAGLLYDLGSHLIDQCRVMVGDPESMEADLQIQRRNSKVIDYFKIIMQYKDFKVVLSSDMFSKEPGPVYMIQGRDESYIKYGMDPQEQQLDNPVIDWENLGIEKPENYGVIVNRNTKEEATVPTRKGTYYMFYENVFEAIREGEQLMVKPEEALEVIRMIEKVLETPVKTNILN